MKNLSDLSDFKSLKISLASPGEIISWSHGEITKPETINYRTFRPEKDGLFDERIFGPTKDYECYCGKYKRIRYKGVICDKCGVEVTHSRVRRERLGHITLASPVAHVWYFRGIPSQLGALLEVSPRDLESVVYFSADLIVEIDGEKKAETISRLAEELEEFKKDLGKKSLVRAGEISAGYQKEREKIKNDDAAGRRDVESIGLHEKKELAALREVILKESVEREEFINSLEARLKTIQPLSVVTEAEYLDLSEYLEKFALPKMGAEALLYVLERFDLAETSRSLKRQLTKFSGQKLARVAKRLRVCESFRGSGVNPAWTVLRHLVVIPPELRPMVQLEGGRFATSDLNDLYRRVINRNNRLKKLMDLGAPEIIVRNEKRMLQEAVDSLIDSSKQRTTAKPMRGRQELRSLSDLLKGKQGRFRRNLLGKRVDYSGRSVIVVGPHLQLSQCGLPKEMVLELFKPFVLGQILKRGLAPNLKSARFYLEARSSEIWDILESLVKDYPVLLNRAPTLHRLGIQAFYPILIEGSAIQLHPCVCSGYNADFDGDQMAVHVPLSQNSLREVRELMLSTENLLSPASGNLLTVPNREMLVGCYYLTSVEESKAGKREGRASFYNEEAALLAYYFGKTRLREPIRFRLKAGEILETTIGRVIFNRALPERLRFFNQETNKENNALRRLIEETLEVEGQAPAVKLIDSLKSLGFHYATVAGLSLGLSDCVVPSEKPEILAKAEADVAEADRNFRRGLVTKREKLRLVEGIWTEVTNRLDDLSRKSLSSDNPLRVMVVSGARGTWDQVKQICGARGLIVDPLGRLVELPIKSNYREGLSGFEYFTSARGARKGLVDTALKTADAGYLTRRLVDVAQDVIVREEDCGSHEGLEIIRGEEHSLTTFIGRIHGRVLAQAIVDPNSPRKTLLKEGILILEEESKLIEENKIDKVKVRSLIFCEADYGICSACYGLDLSKKEPAKVGLTVGIIAAQSIGEPGTQLTLRTKHFSGIATTKDVTQGLPRIEEVFEARTPKFLAVLSEIAGRIEISEKDNKKILLVKAPEGSGFENRAYEVDQSLNLSVSQGDLVGIGSQLCEGYLDLSESLRTRGMLETAKYIITEIQKVYSSQGVSLNDKHVVAIVRQMFSRVRLETGGSTKFLPGEIVSKSLFKEENQKILEKGGEPATAESILLGVTRAALATESFLASASFIETTKELTEASISGKIDRLLGLKENVIISRLVPVGERARRL